MKTTRRRRGDKSYEYLALVEAVREGGKVGHRTLLRLGEVTALRESGQLDRIIAALRAHAERPWAALDEARVEETRSVGAVAAVRAVWDDLGLGTHFEAVGEGRHLSYSLGDAVFAMVANRLGDPCSKRRLPEWLASDVAMPAGFVAPALDQLYWALDQVEAAKAQTETQLYARVCDLTNLDLRLVCYDLTSSYFEGSVAASERFPSRAFGFSRDHRGDRPQIVIGLLTTADGIPIAHHVFAGNTSDVTTLPGVLDDLRQRFGVGGICVVADRGLISADNVETLSAQGFSHVLATRLHRDPVCAAALEASARTDAQWVPVPDAHSAACDVALDGRRYVVVASFERHHRDTTRTTQLVERTAEGLRALERRVRAGELVDAAKIGRAAQRVLGKSGVGRLFDVEMAKGRFLWHYDEEALTYEEALAGRYVLGTSLSLAEASTAAVVRAYRQLLETENRFRVLKDFLHLRPVRHWTERRVRGHVAVCVYAAVIEALVARALHQADVRDPDLADQHLSAPRALRELERIRAVTLDVEGSRVELTTRPSFLQARVLAALGVDTADWDRAHITPRR
ncbi:MAG: IS1634 family transposase [Actinobacteria bacterium]|nr:IS1634 family transposase [Actinomycetota bacterium]